MVVFLTLSVFLIVTISYVVLVVPYVRIGVVVVFLTQWCEFLLELWKIINYFGDRDDKSEARLEIDYK